MSDKPIILMTGSSGMIGRALGEALAPEFVVVGLDVKYPETEIPGVHWIECDLTETVSVSNALSQTRELFGDRLASVLHLAAYYDFSGEPSPLYRDLTVEGTRRLITQLKDFEVEQFLFSSSLLVMKPVENERDVLTETSKMGGEWDYPSSKIEAETVLLNEHGDVPLVVLRISGVYDDNCHSIPLSRHIARIYEKDFESVLFPGEADHGQPYVHLEDLVDCVRRCVQLREDLGREEVFLIAEPDTLSYRELQDRLGELIHGKEWPTYRIPKIVAKAGAWAMDKLPMEEAFIKPWMIDLADDHYPVENSRARNRLGWDPAHDLREELKTIVENLRKDPERWYRENDLPVPESVQGKSLEIRSFGSE